MVRPNIIHVMKDGTILPSVAGHIVREADVPEFYRLLDKINSQRRAQAQAQAQSAQEEHTAN